MTEEVVVNFKYKNYSRGELRSIGVNLRKKPEFSKKRKEGCRERKKLK